MRVKGHFGRNGTAGTPSPPFSTNLGFCKLQSLNVIHFIIQLKYKYMYLFSHMYIIDHALSSIIRFCSYMKGSNCSYKQQIHFWFIILMENNFEKISCKYLFCPFEKQPCLDGGFAMIGCDQLCAYASHKQPMCRI